MSRLAPPDSNTVDRGGANTFQTVWLGALHDTEHSRTPQVAIHIPHSRFGISHFTHSRSAWPARNNKPIDASGEHPTNGKHKALQTDLVQVEDTTERDVHNNQNRGSGHRAQIGPELFVVVSDNDWDNTKLQGQNRKRLNTPTK
jgi:hypothetical protein